MRKNSRISLRSLDNHEPFGYNTAMNSTLTTYTATFTVHDHIPSERLKEEVRLSFGVNADNIEWHDHPNITNFTVTCVLFEDEVASEVFPMVAKDLGRWLGVPVTLGEVILDN